jgi:hypothetical protein
MRSAVDSRSGSRCSLRRVSISTCEKGFQRPLKLGRKPERLPDGYGDPVDGPSPNESGSRTARSEVRDARSGATKWSQRGLNAVLLLVSNCDCA